MATITHTRGDTLPLALPLPNDASGVTLQVHTATACIEIDGAVAAGVASFDPAALDDLRPGRPYRTTARTTLANGAIKTIDSFVVLILEGCGTTPPVPPISVITASILITPSTIIQEAA